jgi:putative FmdB family regulatory protein
VPTYDYQCRSCGSVTEVIHSMLEQGPARCERCGGDLRRVIYPAGIIFKGSGFYRTDSRGTDTSSDSGGGTTASGGSTSGSSTSGGDATSKPASEPTTGGASAGDGGKKGRKKGGNTAAT